jgi:putative ABC transport system permease protein
VVAVRTVVVAIVLGTVLTLLSSLAPGCGPRISPMAAMREGAVGASKVKHRWVRVLKTAVAGLGLVLMLVGLATSPALTLLGSARCSSSSASCVATARRSACGADRAAAGGHRRSGSPDRPGNAVRSPGRAAGMAAALMIGIALMAFVAILVNGFKASFSGAFEKTVTAQLVAFDASGLTREAVAPAAAKLAGVAAASNIRVGKGKAAVGRRCHPVGPGSNTCDGGRGDPLGRGFGRHAALP